MKIDRRALARFLAIALAAVVVLMALGFVLPYPRAFRAVGNAVFDSFGADRVARFDAFDDPTGMHDTRISVGQKGRGYPKGLSMNSLRVGWTPTALILALVLATPMGWPRRWRLLGVGFALTQLFVALRLSLTLAWGFSEIPFDGKPLLELSDHASWLVKRLQQTLSGDLHISWIAPALIWVVVCRREILAAFQADGEGGSSSSSSESRETRSAALSR